ncbi:hypothetical protein [Qipengyuania marisflavi]|uniref:HNH endonuclease n=1 Tax=Qipengyuania marisflavi TaxID=2486356 RepID=A0A5S3NZ77_9SPHN|nr:hypothetical protein [Qipengyuania marisflavi]TMM45828.1 hypothetical protein FEV51_12100 [Qipengyuania marisflavi]
MGESKTLIGNDGKVLVFSVEDFVERICNSKSCFVCGAQPGTTSFNDEHVIPNWLLKRFNLFGKSITLPNGEQHRYGTYKMKCCANCNSLLGESLEQPTSEMLSGGFDGINLQLMDPVYGSLRRKALYVWLCLLFIKTHLKDKELQQHLDPRIGSQKIADQYVWQMLHHIHCVARFPYVGGEICSELIGTMAWFRIQDDMVADEFDYFDLTYDSTIVLRIGDIGIVAVLTDAGKCSLMLRDVLSEVRGKTLTMVQLRELGARLALANRQLLNKPHFYTAVDRRQEPPRVAICVQPDPTLECEDLDAEQLGEIMAFALQNFMGNLQVNDTNSPEDVAAEILKGQTSFILDEEMRFMNRIIAKPA